MKIVLIFLSLIFFSSCNAKSQHTQSFIKEIVLGSDFIDTCLVFKSASGDTMLFNRKVEVLENTFTDTVNIGFHLLYPKQTGQIFISQYDTATDRSMYASPEYIDYINKHQKPERLTKLLCIYNLSKNQQTNDTAKQVLRVRIETDE